MQLKDKSLRSALALAACSAIAGKAVAQSNADEISGTVLFYQEQDRVSVFAPTMFYTSQLGEEETLTVNVVYDSLSGASPNGAVAVAADQIFTGASGGAAYTTNANELPMRTFEDTRVAAGLSWNKRVSPATSRVLNANVSKETDYLSMGGSLSFARDTNQKLTTFAFGAGVALDFVQPHGGAPTPLMAVSTAVNQALAAAQNTNTGGGGNTCTTASGQACAPALLTRDDDHDDHGESGSSGGERDDDGEGDGESGSSGIGISGESKVVFDVMVGVTQVLSRKTLLQVNYSHTLSSGYLNDPYKMLSLLDANGNPIKWRLVTNGTTETVELCAVGSAEYASCNSETVFEQRPDKRNADVIFTKLVHTFGQDVTHLSYRYFQDDWGIQSHTVDAEYRWYLGESFYLEPQYRWYTQTEADFFRYYLVKGEDEGTQYASSDQRLGAFTSNTVGLKAGVKFDDMEVSARYAVMEQVGDSKQADSRPALAGQDLYPGLRATMLTVGFSMPW